MLAPKTHLKSMGPKLNTMSRQKDGKIQLAWSNSMQAQIRSVPGFQRCYKSQEGYNSILGKSKNAFSGRPAAKTLIYEPGGKESVLLKNILSTQQEAPSQSGNSTHDIEESWIPQDSRWNCG